VGCLLKSRIALIAGMCGILAVGGHLRLGSSEAKASANSEPDLVAYFVSWHVMEHGSSHEFEYVGSLADPQDGYTDKSHSMNLEMTGSAIERYRADNGVYFDIRFLSVTLQHNDNNWIHNYRKGTPGVDCTAITHDTIIDPGAYSGFHADFATHVGDWDLIGGLREPALQTSKRLEKAFAPSLDYMTFINRHTSLEQGPTCNTSSRSQEYQLHGGFSVVLQGPKTLAADSADGTSFSLNRQYTYIPPQYPNENRYVTWTARAYRMGKCAQRKGPIPETDPIVENEEVHVDADDSEIAPDSKTKLHIRVTCDGVPVEGANVEIKVEPVDSSGGHIHVNNRPKGKLNGTDLTSANPSITLATDQNGTVKGPTGITFAPPGKQPVSRCLGLAGDYKVTATSEKFTDRSESTMIKVGLNGLVMLPPGQNYDICADSVNGCSKAGPWGTADHPESEYGTPGTIQAFQNVATDFWNQQAAHNTYLQTPACGKNPWPQIKVSFNDIALPWGGLFDMNSTWQQPHKSHGKGQGGDVNHIRNETCKNASGQVVPCLSCGGATVNLNTFLWSVLKATAQPKYGHWDGEVNTSGELHLHVEDQGQGPPSSCPADN
jgi:hypothetical protein